LPKALKRLLAVPIATKVPFDNARIFSDTPKVFKKLQETSKNPLMTVWESTIVASGTVQRHLVDSDAVSGLFESSGNFCKTFGAFQKILALSNNWHCQRALLVDSDTVSGLFEISW